MIRPVLGILTQEELFYFWGSVFLVFLCLLTSSCFGWWKNRQKTCPSPYTGSPLRKGSDLHWMTIEKVLRFLYDMHDFRNPMFDLNKAAVCRDTGRVFPDVLTWHGSIKVDWSFLKKRFPGSYVSWGSLTEEQKLLIKEKHRSLEGYQTEHSSPQSRPRKIEKEYIYTKPGPLYVDVETGVLLGWKCVPGTELEVLIVQMPFEKYVPGLGIIK